MDNKGFNRTLNDLINWVSDKNLGKRIETISANNVSTIEEYYRVVMEYFLQEKSFIIDKKAPFDLLDYIKKEIFNKFGIQQSEDFYMRLFEKKLNIVDYIEINGLDDYFSHSIFLESSSLEIYNFLFDSKNKDLIIKHQDFIEYFIKSGQYEASDLDLSNLDTNDREADFSKMVRSWYDKINPGEFTEYGYQHNLYFLPDYLHSFGFQIIQSYSTLDEMLEKGDSTFVRNWIQRDFLGFFSLSEIEKICNILKVIASKEEIKDIDLLNFLGYIYCITKNDKTPKKDNIYAFFYDTILHSLIYRGTNSVTSNAFYNAISYLDKIAPDYVKYCNKSQIAFIHYVKKNFEEFKSFINFVKEYRSIDFTPVINFCIDNYFSDNGLNEDFYKRALTDKAFFIILPMLDSNYLEKYSEAEKGYIKFLKMFSDIPEPIMKKYGAPQEIDKYFKRDFGELNKEFVIDVFRNFPQYLIELKGNSKIIEIIGEKTILLYELKAEFRKRFNYDSFEFFLEYIKEHYEDLSVNKMKSIYQLIFRIKNSNSSEIIKFADSIMMMLINYDDPLAMFERIEDIFVRNNLPTIGKKYICFMFLYPDFENFNYNLSIVSPALKHSSKLKRKIIIFSDLLKTAFGSNNRSIKSYLKNIRVGTELYESIKNGQLRWDILNFEQREELIKFRNHLITLYYNTRQGKKQLKNIFATDDVINDIFELSKLLLPNITSKYNFADRVVSMFCHFAGIDTLEEAENYMKSEVMRADVRNRKLGKNGYVTLEFGDYIKGINDIEYLGYILQNGSVSKDFLCANAEKDGTPLDTDLSVITTNGTIREQISNTLAGNYGKIWLVLKNDDRFQTTRKENYECETNFDLTKLEVFYTGALRNDQYGIRTGFASSEINCIICENYDPRIGLEIAMNGFYIPVANMEGKIIFTPEDYDRLRKKMNGLSYYDSNEFVFSKNLVNNDVRTIEKQINLNKSVTDEKRRKILKIINEVLEELNLKLKTNVDGDLSPGYVEVLDTGSTGRNTNMIGKGDFDFIFRFDKEIISDSKRMGVIKDLLKKKLGKESVGSNEITHDGHFRFKSVKLENDLDVDIDISFIPKRDTLEYSTDMALKDRFETICKQSPEYYSYIIANIILAKQVLYDGEVYKSANAMISQGGLSGVGIENWILQNGGSFLDAATDFLKCAKDKSFEEFKNSYQVWDFGDKLFSDRSLHRNFVENCMSEEGYRKMITVLHNYVNERNINKEWLKIQ